MANLNKIIEAVFAEENVSAALIFFSFFHTPIYALWFFERYSLYLHSLLGKLVAEYVWTFLATEVPSNSLYTDFPRAKVQKELQRVLKQFNATWTGTEGKIDPGPKVHCSIQDFVALLGPSKVSAASDYSVIRIVAVRFPCSACEKIFLKEISCQQHFNAVHASSSSSSSSTTLGWYCVLCERTISSRTSQTQHEGTRAHQSNLRRKNSTCKECGVPCGSENGLKLHMLKRHRPAAPPAAAPRTEHSKSERERSFCDICQVFCGTITGLQKHRAKRHSDSGSSSTQSSSSASFFCEICNRSFNNANQKAQHDQSLGHRMKMKEKAGEQLLPNIHVEAEFANIRKQGDVQFDIRKCPSSTVKIIISNTGSGSAFLNNVFAVPAMDSVNVASLVQNPTEIGAGRALSVPVTIRTDLIGTLPFRIFVRLNTGDKLVPITINVIDDVVVSLAPARPYSRPEVPVDLLADNPDIIDGEKPTELPAPSTITRLMTYLGTDTPAEFVNKLAQLSPQILTWAKRLIGGPVSQALRTLSGVSGLKLMQYLLHFEQQQLTENIRFYNITRARMENRGKYLRLQVNGLAEKRPSILIGDSVIARNSYAQHSRRAWRAYVHQVERDGVLLRFNQQFHDNFIPGAHFDIQFSLNDYPVRRCLTAIEFLMRTNKFDTFFNPIPSYSYSNLDAWRSVARISDDHIIGRPLNERQKQAVGFMVFGPAIQAPYILFGPAGTGKTTTIVEAILQVHRYIQKSKILVITPSNSSADHVVSKLSTFLKPIYMFRLNALHRRSETVPENVLPYSFERAQDWFGLPGMNNLRSKSVIVSTCISAAMLYGVGIGEHFTHVFVDEASQATEPETLIGLAGITAPNCKFLLGGDPKQLGPIIHSLIARRLGFDKSFMERLFSNGTYFRSPEYAEYGGYNPFYITKLTHNYRSHQSLLQVPSNLFYESELIPSADKDRSDAFVGWSQLPNVKVPLIFHSVTYKDEREENSPSFFNAGEASVVVDYTKKILNYSRWPVRRQDIGIISPYHKQVQKIRTALTKEGLYDPTKGADQIKIASVEEFQGQERLVIIVSTVRSSPDLVLAHDAKFNLGFLKNEKRLNVAITRAQALLVVVGSPSVLYHDPNWKFLIDFCINNDAYRGNPPPVADPSLYVNELNLNDGGAVEGVSDRLIGRDD